ncbi:HNH endonuclease signature motif containing protein, partial [Pseudarthrobacter phenanthrenivorans]
TTATARGLQNPNEHRTLTQLRPDIAASLLLGAGSFAGGAGGADTTHADAGHGNPAGEAAGSTGGIGKVPTPRADVLITVPVFALLGLTDEPAELDGYGPIPAFMARKLVADGADSFHRVLVDPRDGAPLEIGRTRYRLTPAIKRWLRIRDRKCSFPGCSNHTPDNDTDHLTAWHHGGATDVSNLAQLCPKHHRLKHHSHWTPDPATPDEPPGWTSPTGRHYNPEHPTPEPTHWPPGIQPVDAVAEANAVAASRGPTGPGTCVPTNAAGSDGATARLEDVESEEDEQWEQLLADMPAWPDPPLEEPDGENLLDPRGLPASDPLWEDFYARPFFLPPDPFNDWELLESQT